MHTWTHIWKSLCGRVHFDMLSSCPTCNEVWERFSHSSPSPPFLSLCLSSFHITFISFHHRLTAPQYLFIYLGLWEKKRVKLSLWGGGKQIVMHSWDHPCWRDGIWHMFRALQLCPFDACTNTGNETAVSKCFDAISQQSVKQKTFVAWKQCQHKRTRRSVDRSRVSLFMPLRPLRARRVPRVNPALVWTGKDTGGSRLRRPVVCG